MLRRFIPTRAGKISIKTGAAAAAPGSSPLARGKFKWGTTNFQRWWFIPTRAGKIARPHKPPVPAPVHPHSRGENRVFIVGAACAVGSSPLARGKFALIPSI